MASPGVGGSLSAASDVYFNNPVQDNTLKYNNSLHMWTNGENTTTIGGVSGLQEELDGKATIVIDPVSTDGLADGTLIAYTE